MAEPHSEKCVYAVDSSSWILIEGHPAQNLILDRLTQLIEAGRIKSPREVLAELRKTSPVTQHVEHYRDLIIENPTSEVEYLHLVGRVTNKFPAMQGARRKKERADAWVIGLAAHGRGNPRDWIVVADETDAKRPNRKIPTACAEFNVRCCGLIQMLQEEFPDDVW